MLASLTTPASGALRASSALFLPACPLHANLFATSALTFWYKALPLVQLPNNVLLPYCSVARWSRSCPLLSVLFVLLMPLRLCGSQPARCTPWLNSTRWSLFLLLRSDHATSVTLASCSTLALLTSLWLLVSPHASYCRCGLRRLFADPPALSPRLAQSLVLVADLASSLALLRYSSSHLGAMLEALGHRLGMFVYSCLARRPVFSY